ncbi:MAG: ArnT family glycosyltransferase [Thermoleophilia bacterium]
MADTGSGRSTFRRMMTGGLPVRTEVIIVAAFTLLLMLPFLARPFHMDDAGFIELARARLDQPLQTVLHDYTFFGQENAEFLDTHPPLVPSYIAVVIKVAGESETAGHAAFLVFPLIAAISMYCLARRYTRHALLAALLFIATPGAMVMSQGLMSDMPGVAFWLAAVTLYVYALDRNRLWMMALCGIAITLGVFTSYQVLSVIPLLFVYALVRRKLSLLAILPFVLPLSSFASYAVWHYYVLGVLPRLSYGVGAPLAWYSIVQKGASVFATAGGAVVFFVVLMRVLLRKSWDFAVYLAFIVPLWFAALFQFLTGSYSAGAAVMTILFIPLGILYLYQIFADGWQRLDDHVHERQAGDVLLLLWLAGVLFYLVVLLPYASVRYLLPAFAPLILLFVRLAEDRAGDRGTEDRAGVRGAEDRAGNGLAVGRILAAAVLATAGLGFLVAGADYQLASANRAFAQNQGAAYGSTAAAEGHQVWFVGEFGFRYYMEQQGFRELPKDTQVAEGDLIIQSPLADPRPFSEVMERRVELIDTVGYSGLLPLRTISFSSKAGFYGHFWGILPWSVDFGNVEEYLVYRVVPEKQRLWERTLKDYQAPS